MLIVLLSYFSHTTTVLRRTFMLRGKKHGAQHTKSKFARALHLLAFRSVDVSFTC